MNTLNSTGDNIMIRMRKKNYIQERQNNFNLKEEINGITVGGNANLILERLWRGKTQSYMRKTNPEENYLLKEIMKKYQTNQDELKGYNYKYVLQLSDLLGQKDKNFSKKRLELYNHRIEREKKQYSKNNEKFIKYQTAYKPKKQSNFFMDYFNTSHNKTKNSLIKNKLNNTFYNNGKNRNNNNYEIYNKTSYNCNSPNKFEKFAYLLNEKNKKSKIKFSEKKYNNMEFELNKNNEIVEEFDNTSLIGKEDFLVSGDKEKYHEYLKKEYNFFHPIKIRQMKYLFDKEKRIKLFKKLPNAKYLTYKKENPLRIELFNKINREKQKLSQEFPKSINKKFKLNYDNKKDYMEMKTKPNINNEYQNIITKLKNNLCIE